MFDKSWEKKIYKKNKQMNDYPYDWVVSTTNKFLKKRKKLNALEIGSGTGNNLNFLKAFGFNKIVGIEGSKSACDYARKKFKKDKSIKILNLDFNKYSYDEKFNLILDRGSLTHNKINDIKKTLNKINYSLKNNGFFFSVMFTNEHLYSTKRKDSYSFKYMTEDKKGVIANFFSKREIIKLFNKFKIIELKKEIHEIHLPKKRKFSTWNLICKK